MTEIALLEEVVFVHMFLRIPLLLLLSLVTLGIQVLRSHLYEYRFYRPFLVNIVLAWIPFILSIVAYVVFLRANLQASVPMVGILIIWFVFFPNSIYLITEVHHFQDETTVPLWFDTIAILLIVTTGILVGIHSLAIIHLFIRVYAPAEGSWIFLIAYVYLATFGIFLGRYLRFNSWDVIKRPWRLFSEIRTSLDTNEERRNMLLFTTLFTLFIVGFYYFDAHLSLWTEYNLGLRILELREALSTLP